MEDLIECNPKIMVGKPVIKGTRITVELILEKLAAGETFDSILSQYPHLSREAVSSAVRFALQTVRDDYPTYTENHKLLDSLNNAYSEALPSEEKKELQLMKNKSFEALDEWK